MPLEYDTTYLLVGKIVSAKTAPDQIFIRVYGPRDHVDRGEPAVWSLASKPVYSDEVFDQFVFHSNSTSRQRMGEIRLGDTWAAVAGCWSK